VPEKPLSTQANLSAWAFETSSNHNRLLVRPLQRTGPPARPPPATECVPVVTAVTVVVRRTTPFCRSFRWRYMIACDPRISGGLERTILRSLSVRRRCAGTTGSTIGPAGRRRRPVHARQGREDSRVNADNLVAPSKARAWISAASTCRWERFGRCPCFRDDGDRSHSTGIAL
jgi:hypothetical protein